MSKKKQEVWTKRCPDGSACAPIDYEKLNKASKRDIKTAVKNNYAGFRNYDQTYFIPYNYDICDVCLEYHFNLTATYDALDYLSMYKLYTEEEVIKALRQARKEGELND